MVVRAFDDSPAANEERNQVVLTGTPGPAAPYLGRLHASNGPTTVTYRFSYEGSWSKRRVYIDRDRMLGSGQTIHGIGADLLIQEGTLFKYAGHGTDSAWTELGPVAMSTRNADGLTSVQWN